MGGAKREEACVRPTAGWPSSGALAARVRHDRRAKGSTSCSPPAPPRVGIDFTTKGGHPRRSRGHREPQDKPVAELELHSDRGKPDVLAVGPVSMYLIERGGRHALRVKDTESAQRRGFRGLEWYPVREDLRIRARFTPYDPPKKIPIANVVGMVDPLPSPGYVTFQLDGRELRLDPVLEEPDAKELFYIFRDATAGKDTYPAGRFLYSEMPKDGQVVLDFNKAYSPPCAFTSFATCPLPPRQNRLDVRIEAGEKKPPGH
jgi:uncharacterized protein (DUF1684 family)